jgi:hypothetical protein
MWRENNDKRSASGNSSQGTQADYRVTFLDFLMGMPSSETAAILDIAERTLKDRLREAAKALGLSLRTAERNWTYARSWLGRELSDSDSADPGRG